MDEIRQGEPLIKEYRLFELLSKIPWIIKRVIIWVLFCLNKQMIKKK